MVDGITDTTDINMSKLRDSRGQWSQACCSPWGRKGSDMAKRLSDSKRKPTR